MNTASVTEKVRYETNVHPTEKFIYVNFSSSTGVSFNSVNMKFNTIKK